MCDEPISNVYQTLIAYNGTQDGPTAASYVPQLATCVPGSLECAAQFGGNDLVYDNNTTGAPQYYTFEIDSGARFYDSAHSASWAVYPSDVLFTFARTMGFADLPYEEATNGWINTQELVAAGNSSWDGGIHAPLNNTPQSILNAFLVNDSYYCPSSPVVTTDGCITFNVGASGQSWPYFLELVADNLGGSIQSCGWDTANGGGVPGFPGSNASNGDGPCLLPGSSTSTQDPGYLNYVSSTAPTGWDSFEELALNTPAVRRGSSGARSDRARTTSRTRSTPMSDTHCMRTRPTRHPSGARGPRDACHCPAATRPTPTSFGKPRVTRRV